MLNQLKDVLTVEMVRSLIAKIKGALATKLSMGDVVSSWQSTPDDAHVPTEKLVKDTLDNLPPGTAVKGDAESEYRTGNVNLTPANIGAATASQGAKADTAVQGVKVNGTDLSKDSNNVVDVPVPTASTATPLKDGTASAGSSSQWAKGDHRHPTDDSREAVGNKKQSIDPTSTTEYGSSKAVAEFVNSSVATNTANFLGTIAESSLGLDYTATNAQIELALNVHSWESTPTNNDYCFVSVNNPQTTDVDEYRRFKFNDKTNLWGYEYTLNNSSFTKAQWDAINSGLTSSDRTAYNAAVTLLNSHVENGDIHVTAEQKTAWTAKQNAVSTDTDSSAFGDNTAIATGFSSDKLHLNIASRLWTYIQGKISSVLGLTASSYGGSAATATSATTATNYASGGGIANALAGKSGTSHTHSVKINGTMKTIPATGDTAVDLGTYLTSHQDISGKLDKTGDASNTTSTFTKASGDTSSMTSGGKLSAIFGAISSFFASLKALAFKDKVTDSDISGTISDSHIASASTWNGKYAKPSGGIPKTDLASAVQTSLGKADSALQSHQDISGKANLANTTQSILSEPYQSDGSKYLVVSQSEFGGSSAWMNYDLVLVIQSRHSGSGIAVIQCNVNTSSTTENALTGTIQLYTSNSSVRLSSPMKMYRKYKASTHMWTVTVVVSCGDYNEFQIKSVLSKRGGLNYSTTLSYITDLNSLGTLIATATIPSFATYESKRAESGGTDVSLCTTGEKYTWNSKQNAVSTDTDSSAFGDNTTIATGFGSDKVHLNIASRLWTYIQGKISNVLGLTASNYGGKASSATQVVATASQKSVAVSTEGIQHTNGSQSTIIDGGQVSTYTLSAESAVNSDGFWAKSSILVYGGNNPGSPTGNYILMSPNGIVCYGAASFTGSLVGNASTATAVKDYGNTSKSIEIGYAGDSLTSANFLAAYAVVNGHTYIKDISPSNVTVGRATSDGSGNNIVNTYQRKMMFSASVRSYSPTIAAGSTASVGNRPNNQLGIALLYPLSGTSYIEVSFNLSFTYPSAGGYGAYAVILKAGNSSSSMNQIGSVIKSTYQSGSSNYAEHVTVEGSVSSSPSYLVLEITNGYGSSVTFNLSTILIRITQNVTAAAQAT